MTRKISDSRPGGPQGNGFIDLLLDRHEPVRPFSEHLKSAAGGLLCMLLIAATTQVSGMPLMLAPLGATAVILFGYPGTAVAQPINVFGGYLVATTAGVAVAMLCPHAWWAVAPAVGLSLFLMQTLRVTHPPAGAVPVIAQAMHQNSVSLFVILLLSCVGMLVFALVFHALPPRRRYPAPNPAGLLQQGVVDLRNAPSPVAQPTPAGDGTIR